MATRAAIRRRWRSTSRSSLFSACRAPTTCRGYSSRTRSSSGWAGRSGRTTARRPARLNMSCSSAGTTSSSASGSDHTDRGLEGLSIEKSKQIYPKIVSRQVWRLDELLPRWDDPPPAEPGRRERRTHGLPERHARAAHTSRPERLLDLIGPDPGAGAVVVLRHAARAWRPRASGPPLRGRTPRHGRALARLPRLRHRRPAAASAARRTLTALSPLPARGEG